MQPIPTFVHFEPRQYAFDRKISGISVVKLAVWLNRYSISACVYHHTQRGESTSAWRVVIAVNQ